MLQWLSPDFNDEDKVFFCERFVTGLMNSETEHMKFQQFAKKMLNQNKKTRNFNTCLLQKQLQKQIQIAFLKFVVGEYFNHGYSYQYYIPYLRSRLILKVSIKNNIKFLLKSITMHINS